MGRILDVQTSKLKSVSFQHRVCLIFFLKPTDTKQYFQAHLFNEMILHMSPSSNYCLVIKMTGCRLVHKQ